MNISEIKGNFQESREPNWEPETGTGKEPEPVELVGGTKPAEPELWWQQSRPWWQQSRFWWQQSRFWWQQSRSWWQQSRFWWQQSRSWWH